ncbi:hypothetical protein [ANMV-1 virus]|nr:hypothetical protein [ANMV-1 virus]
MSVYRLNLVPGEEARRPEWNLILVSDIAVTVDFFHTDMLEKVISIKKVDTPTEIQKSGDKEG